MGLYPVDCQVCQKPFLWFSGSVFQVCPTCLEAPVETPEELRQRLKNEAIDMIKEELEKQE